jgi:hypothetical protein
VVLQFVRVLDTYEFGGDDEDESGPTELTDRAYWEKRAQPETLVTIDAIVSLISAAGGVPKVTYNRTHIAVGTSGYNFAWFYPRKVATHCPVRFKIGSKERPAIMTKLEEAGLEAENKGQASIQMFLKPNQVKEHSALLGEIIQAAEQWSNR